jgi:hypothetical protein
MLQQILSQLGFKYANVPYRISDLLALLSILVFLRIFHLITEAYRNQGGNKSSFAIPSLAEYQVLACSKDDIKELCNSSPEVLSFHAAMSDVCSHLPKQP